MTKFEVSPEVKQRGISEITLEESIINVHYNEQHILITVYKESPTKTLEQLDKLMDGSFDPETKEALKLCISSQWEEKIPNLENSKKEKQPTKPELVLKVAEQHCVKLFIDEYQVAYAAILVEEHLEALPLCSKRFRDWVARTLHKEENIILDNNALKDAIAVLSARAIFDSGDPIKLNLRTALSNKPIEYRDDITTNRAGLRLVWYYDLTNKDWEFIEITSESWRTAKGNELIIFRRFNNQVPQVHPSDYEPDIFDKFIRLILNVNIKNENRKNYELLLKCYIISLFIPDIPKVALMLHGHQGSAKSTLMGAIKMLVDPSQMKTLSFPRDKNELIQQLSHNYLAFYDNVSKLPKWISDEICRAVTGSGFSKRVLYSDDDDFIYNLKRCVAINSINLVAISPDLLDRGLNFELKRIEDKDNRRLEDVMKEIGNLIPQLLAYILDILVKVLKFKETNPEFKLAKYPRMADFAEYGEIISRSMGYEDNEFIEAYWRNIRGQVCEIIESSQIATALMYLMFIKYGEQNNDIRAEWQGTASALLGELNNVAVTEALNIDIKNKYWPKGSAILSRRLNELGPTLKDADLQIEFLTNQGPNKARIINIRKVSPTSSTTSQEQNQVQNTTDKGDDIP